MTKLTAPSLLFALSLIAGCTSASGPTFNAYTIDTNDGVRTYRVECQGVFEGSNTCRKAAERICGDKPVQPIEKIGQVGSDDNRIFTFRCEAPSTPAAAEKPVATVVPVAVAAPPERFDLSGDTNFDVGRATLTSAATDKLDGLLVASKGTVFKTVTIEGYTDSTGSSRLNRDLSKRRADNVEQYLKSHGLRSDNYVARGEGSANPVASNNTAIGRAQNRRVEIRLTQ